MEDWFADNWEFVLIAVAALIVVYVVVRSAVAAAMRQHERVSGSLEANIGAVQTTVDRMLGQAKLNEITEGHLAGVYGIVGLILGLLIGLTSEWVLVKGPSLWNGWDVFLEGALRFVIVGAAGGVVAFVITMVLIPRFEKALGKAADSDGSPLMTKLLRFLNRCAGRSTSTINSDGPGGH